MRARLLCVAGAIVLMTAIPAAHPASAQGLNDIVRNLNNTMNPSDAQRRDDQARRRDGRSEEGQYRPGDRPTRPNPVNIGTAAIEEITVTAAMRVSGDSLPSARRDRAGWPLTYTELS
jgi:hypothetical protein